VKIAFVIGSLSRGGTELQVIELARTLHPHRAECTVICLQEPGPLAPLIEERGIPVYALGFGGGRLGASVRAVARLARVLRTNNFDAVYALLFWSYALAIPLAAVFSPRTGRVSGRQTMPALDVPRKTIFLPMRGLADRLSDLILVNSADLLKAWATVTPSAAPKLRVIRNGVRLPEPAPRRRNRPSQLRVVSVGNYKPYKGHRTLLDAASRLPKGLSWTLELAGEGPERDRIAHQVNELGLRRNVKLLGTVDDVSRLLSEADIFVHPSYTEGSSNAVLEAMAHGVPVVATDVGGVRELIGMEAGFVVPPHDPAALARALEEMLRDEGLRAHAGASGRARAQGHSIDRFVTDSFAAIKVAAERRRDPASK
jgi:L-malate glycosyltransferase